jgi:hypothetical protein
MKNLFAFAAILLFVVVAQNDSMSQDKGFGLGVIVGEPTGFSLKSWLSSKTAVDGAVAWSFSRETSFHIHADYLIHSFDEFTTEEKVPLFYGIGGRFKSSKNGDARLGVRGVIGMGFMFRTAPIDLFLEIAPILDFAPDTDLSFNGGFGARYFFK